MWRRSSPNFLLQIKRKISWRTGISNHHCQRQKADPASNDQNVRNCSRWGNKNTHYNIVRLWQSTQLCVRRNWKGYHSEQVSTKNYHKIVLTAVRHLQIQVRISLYHLLSSMLQAEKSVTFIFLRVCQQERFILN